LHGLFDVWSFRELCAFVASGLGGGSLIYAGVLLRKDPRTFVKEDLTQGGYEFWPVTYDDLEPHYANVDRMLGAQRYPFAHEPYAATAKTRALQAAAEALGLEWFLPNLGITFANPGEAPVPGAPIREEHPNLHARSRSTCCLCGECNVGCNFGSKNSLDYTYLSAAQRHGAVILPRHEVRSFRPRDGGGYAIGFVEHADAQDGEQAGPARPPLQTVTADRLILAAGTFGSTYLLLKNRAAFPAMSTQLGTRFSANGDLLMFLGQGHDGSTGARAPRILDGGHGPVITSTIRIKDELEGGEGSGFYLQDAGYPEFVNWVLEASHPPDALRRGVRLASRVLRSRLGLGAARDVGAEIVALLGPCEFAASSLPLLAMGRDIPNGRMRLSGDRRLVLDWRERDSADYYRMAREAAKEIAGALQATFRGNPLWYLRRAITAHPLGGCPMGRNEREGVVDPYGGVFRYPGLYVADGSIVPGPVGPNPSLTIAALADRCAERIIEDDRRAGGGGVVRRRAPPSPRSGRRVVDPLGLSAPTAPELLMGVVRAGRP
jgi:cholesterol oxidase